MSNHLGLEYDVHAGGAWWQAVAFQLGENGGRLLFSLLEVDSCGSSLSFYPGHRGGLGKGYGKQAPTRVSRKCDLSFKKEISSIEDRGIDGQKGPGSDGMGFGSA
uniref:Uncharacterized protein n=1 Tax=Oryza meridionalis TaxID=40149 RepID=A0A0E0D2Z2_9ORYZ